MTEAERRAEGTARTKARRRAVDVLFEAEKILLDDYIFAPISIVPGRHMVKPSVHGWEDSAAGYNNSQWMSLD